MTSRDRFSGDMVRCFLALRGRGVPVSLTEYKLLYDGMRGQGTVAIVNTLYHYNTSNQSVQFDEVIPMREIPYDERFAQLVAVTDWQEILPWSE